MGITLLKIPKFDKSLQYITFVSCREYVKEWQEKKVSVVVWTVNTSAEKNYFAGVLKCPILTDCIKGDVESVEHS